MNRRENAFAHRQGGSALMLVVIAAVALVGVVGVALDASHMGYMKARLQSTIDAMALAAAKKLDETGSTAAACGAAREVLLENVSSFKELARSMPADITCPANTWYEIDYSSTIAPFVSGTTPARYVRVAINELSTAASLSTVLGVVDIAASASAIAGPSAPLSRLCNLLPVAVCGTSATPYFGFEPGRLYLLKGKKNTSDGTNIGDFHLLRPDPADDTEKGLRSNFAGGFGSCVVVSNPDGPTPSIAIKPGSNVGPVGQGVNTRFNTYNPAGQLNPIDYPPDVLIGEPSPKIQADSSGVLRQGSSIVTFGSEVSGRNRSDYLDRLTQGPSKYDLPPLPTPGGGALLRREVAVPIADCSPPIDENALPIRGAGCFFLQQQMTGGASESQLIGEFLPDCEAAGRPGPGPGTGGPYVIQVFRDFTSRDS